MFFHGLGTSKKNSIFELQNIKTPQVWKERFSERIAREKPTRKIACKKFPVMVAAVISIIVLLTGTALAYALTGGAFFTKIFTQRAELGATDYSYMDVSQLSEIAGKNIGTVVDTDELQIDVTDVLSSGSDAMVALRVTAKQLDSVLLYTGFDEVPLNNYRFGSEDGTLFNNMDSATVQYIYSDEDNSLADNQFYLVLTVTSLDGFKDNPYTIELQSFGYYDLHTASGDKVFITKVYDGPWEINLDLSGDTDHSRTVFLNNVIEISEYKYDIEGVYLTPFSCTAIISYDGDPDLSKERYKAVYEKAADFALYTTEGAPVEHGDVGVMNGGVDSPDSTYHVTVYFDVPVDVENITKIHIFGQDCDIFPTSSATEDRD